MKPARPQRQPRSTDPTHEHREHSYAFLIILAFFLIFSLIGLTFFVANLGKTYDSIEIKLENPNPNNSFIFPTNADTLYKGETYTLRWNGGPQTIQQLDLVNRAYEKEGVSVSLVDRFYNLENTGSYKVTIPTELPAGQYKFQMGPMSSEYFKIEEKN